MSGSQDELLNTEFQKIGPYVTARPNDLRPSRREAKNDVWKYLQIIVIAMFAVCGHLLDIQDRGLSPPWFASQSET